MPVRWGRCGAGVGKEGDLEELPKGVVPLRVEAAARWLWRDSVSAFLRQRLVAGDFPEGGIRAWGVGWRGLLFPLDEEQACLEAAGTF